MKQKHLFAALLIAPALAISCATASTPLDAETYIPDDEAYAYWSRGEEYYSDEKDYDRAIAYYTEAIRLDPIYAIAYVSRGNAYDSKEDYDRAIADYEAALRINPNHTYAKTSLENARRARGR
jgi:tetratricopeptide (TPR) repeat protein